MFFNQQSPVQSWRHRPMARRWGKFCCRVTRFISCVIRAMSWWALRRVSARSPWPGLDNNRSARVRSIDIYRYIYQSYTDIYLYMSRVRRGWTTDGGLILHFLFNPFMTCSLITEGMLQLNRFTTWSTFKWLVELKRGRWLSVKTLRA